MRSKRHLGLVPVVIALLIFFGGTISGCGKGTGGGALIPADTEYQAVFLDNGQVFFGRLSDTGAEYALLKEVYYVQTQQNPETKEVRSILTKRGSEWHGPSYMRINSRHIVVIEPVSPDSKVAKLIGEAKAKKDESKPEEKK